MCLSICVTGWAAIFLCRFGNLQFPWNYQPVLMVITVYSRRQIKVKPPHRTNTPPHHERTASVLQAHRKRTTKVLLRYSIVPEEYYKVPHLANFESTVLVSNVLTAKMVFNDYTKQMILFYHYNRGLRSTTIVRGGAEGTRKCERCWNVVIKAGTTRSL